jgi:NMD protein affecting ribosome stability and mRNA decay
MLDQFRVEIDMPQKMCSSCKKSSSDYYQLKVQFRFINFESTNKEIAIENIKELLIKSFNTINKVEENENYLDVYFRIYTEIGKISKIINQKYFCEEVRSSKIMGKDKQSSKDLYRHTQRFNIINIKIKDKIVIKGEEYIVKAINGKDLIVLSSKDNSKKVFSYNKVKDYLKFLEN